MTSCVPICFFLRPKEIVNELYPLMSTLHSGTDANLDADAREKEIVMKTKEFDAILGNIVNIIVSYDMGWSKRGNGRSYNSLNGYGTIIGFLTGKILDFATRNRKCKLCDTGHDKKDHDCRKNFSGSAKAMEPDVGAALVNDSAILQEAGLNVKVLIGDEDSSTIAAINLENPLKVRKLSDSNHLKKHVMKDLYALQKNFKEMRKKEVIPHLKKCFTYAVSQNQGQSAQLARTIRTIPDHAFGRHENCGTWCKDSHKIELKDDNLYYELLTLFEKYAKNAAKFAVIASSQANESVNNIMAHKAPKKCCYSLSESADYRLASAVCTKNDGEKHLLNVNAKLNVSPGKHTAILAMHLDEKREKRAIKAKLPSTKSRRNLLSQMKEASRKSKERSEGVQYQSNCGMNINMGNATLIDSQRFADKLPNISVSPEDCNIVYFDLETSGFSKNAEILQIAAKFEEYTFMVYLSPTRPIDADASRVTGLTYIKGNMYFHGKPVLTFLPRQALQSFQKFLNFSAKPCILVAHNAPFDSAHLLRLIISHGMIENFSKIAGFSDSLTILRKLFPERKGQKDSFKLQTLARDLLKLETPGQFHEALFDVEVLEKLSHTFIKKESLCAICKTYEESVMTKIILPSLKNLKDVISNGIIKKMAGAGISYEILQQVYSEKREKGVEHLLSKETTPRKADYKNQKSNPKSNPLFEK